TKGPNPVSTSATKKAKPSRPCWLRREGLDGEAGSLMLRYRQLIRQAVRRAEHYQSLAVLVFRCGVDLIARQVQRDAVVLAAGRGERQGIPVDGDPAIADAEKAAEVDDGRAHLSGAIDHHVDHPSHVLAGA